MNRMKLLVALTLAIPAAAFAGFTQNFEVTISGDTAQGTIAGARTSADNIQYMNCVDGDYAYCVARSASGNIQACFTVDDHQRAVIRSVTSNSRIFFQRASDGSCARMYVFNGSQHLE